METINIHTIFQGILEQNITGFLIAVHQHQSSQVHLSNRVLKQARSTGQAPLDCSSAD